MSKKQKESMKQNNAAYQVVPYPKMRRLGGIQSPPLALAAVAPSLSRDAVDGGKVSPDVEEVPGDGGPHGSRDVWERGRMGHPARLPSPLDYGRRHWPEAGGR